MLVTLSASLSFISPMEPACRLVYDAGRHTFFDCIRAGTPLTIICVVLPRVLVPAIWGWRAALRGAGYASQSTGVSSQRIASSSSVPTSQRRSAARSDRRSTSSWVG